jgi:hypothetical protein
MANLEDIKQAFKDTVYSFLDNCVPLCQGTDKCIYFLSPVGQLYGFDTRKNAFFEPNSNSKYSLINNSIDLYFTDQIKKSLEDKVDVKFDDLLELTLRFNYKEKHIGKKFFYSEKHRVIYVWSMMTSKWETGEVDTLKHLFSNNDMLLDENKVYKSNKMTTFEDLGVDMDDLEEVSARFRDGSIHYLHTEQNKIYSLNYLKNFWYIPDEAVQKQILGYIAKKTKLEVEVEKTEQI